MTVEKLIEKLMLIDSHPLFIIAKIEANLLS